MRYSLRNTIITQLHIVIYLHYRSTEKNCHSHPSIMAAAGVGRLYQADQFKKDYFTATQGKHDMKVQAPHLKNLALDYEYKYRISNSWKHCLQVKWGKSFCGFGDIGWQPLRLLKQAILYLRCNEMQLCVIYFQTRIQKPFRCYHLLSILRL